MKHKGAVMEYSMERMNDLMRAYDEYISSCDYIRMPEVYKVIVNMPSRRFGSAIFVQHWSFPS